MNEQKKELYVECLASHNGPGHADVIARCFPKRSTWVGAGVLSLEFAINQDVDAVAVVEDLIRWLI